MKEFTRVATGLDLTAVRKEIAGNSHMFGEYGARKTAPNSPHSEMEDIWVRYGDISKMVEAGDYGEMAEEHDSIWLKDMTAVKDLCFDIMAIVDGERLGGVLITRLPPAGKIKSHIDGGWHAGYYSKYYVPIENEKGACFCFNTGVINPDIGDVWQFDNSKPHWVENKSRQDRIAMIICIKQTKRMAGGDLCHGV